MKHTKKRTKVAGKARKATKQKVPARRTPARATPAAATRPRDPRIPAVGSVITRAYKGRTHQVEVLDDGFRHEGTEYRSLSALAAAITGARSINGVLWFGLTQRPAAPRTTTAASATAEASAAA